ncbi:MAG: hypothetical protein JJV89_01400 [Desulfosarcina sp.]|nr:hypothetical protein [Desulfobacterales bacterium]
MKKLNLPVNSIIFWLVLVIFISINIAEAKEEIAIMDLKPIGVDVNLAAAVSENLRTMIIQTETYEVIERNQIKQILNEYKLSESGLTDEKKALKIGKIANVHKIIIGSINKIFTAYTINVRVLQVETGIIIKAKKIKIVSEANFPDKIDELALLVTESEKKKKCDTKTYNITGIYEVKGAKYNGSMEINKFNEIYTVSWLINNLDSKKIEKFDGIGILNNKIFSVCYKGANQGVASYEILLKGERIRGLYTHFESGKKKGKLKFENGIKKDFLK